MGIFVIRQTEQGPHFELQTADGEVLLTSQIYKGEKTCRDGVRSVTRNSNTNKIENQTIEGFDILPNPKYELVAVGEGQYTYRLVARNGQMIGTGRLCESIEQCLSYIAAVRKNVVRADIKRGPEFTRSRGRKPAEKEPAAEAIAKS